MSRKQRIIVSITGIVLVSLILIGLTYAYFLTKIKGNSNTKSISVTTANLKLVYNDGSDGIIGGELLEPSDTEYIKTFTVKNEGNKNISYGVYLTNVINTFERKDDIKYTISCMTDGSINCSGVNNEVTFPSGIKELVRNEIEPNKTHTYTFKFTYKDTGTDQSIDMNKELSAKIQIFGTNGADFSNVLLDSAKNAKGDRTIYQETPITSPGNEVSTFKYDTNTDNVFLRKDGNISVDSTYQEYYWIYGTGFTINENTGHFTLTGVNSLSSSSQTYSNMYNSLVGKYLISSSASSNSVADTSTANPKTTSNISNIYKVVAATSSQITYQEVLPNIIGVEKTLSKSVDDYGDTYYYRGKVLDNYVNFAGMCWRIVRIAGDGSIKLILEDQNTICDSSSYTGNWNLGDAYFGYDNSIYSGKNIENYLSSVASNSLVNKFKTFQTSKLSNYLDKLKPGGWCYDDTAYASSTSTSGTPLTEEEKNNYYNGTISGNFYYDAYIRLVGQSIKTPTNKCNGRILNKYSDNTDMYVGTLTADETVYAGVKYSSFNYGYYLFNEYQRINSKQWWVLSPYDWSGTNSRSFRLFFFGYLYDFSSVSNSSGSRPSIQLKSTVGLNGGDGTISNPYIVE